MFDVGFSELVLTAVIALVVLGPDRLPGAARTAGLWIGRLKRSFNNLKSEVEREIGADEIRRQLHNERILDLEREMNAMKQNILGTTEKLADDSTLPKPPSPPDEATTKEPAKVAESTERDKNGTP